MRENIKLEKYKVEEVEEIKVKEIKDKEVENRDENNINKPVNKSVRSNLYDKIDVSIKTMDILICFIIVLIIIFTIFGIIQG